jgi:putative hydroxymethylpyrimidine transport system substrate-binding protein
VYDELIYVARRDRVADARMRRFIDATEAATVFILNNPEAARKMFIEGRPELDDELNRRAWRDTWPRFSASPAALDRNRYDRFARWLHERNMIRSVPAVETYAVELAAPR